MEFPASLYKRGSAFLWDGEWFDSVEVSDEEELDIALADGWVPHKPDDVPSDAHTDEQPEPAPPLPPQAPVSPVKRRGRKPKVTT